MCWCYEYRYGGPIITINNGIEIYRNKYNRCGDIGTGFVEFDISSIDDSFSRGQIQADLSLTVKDGDLPNDQCLSFYSIQDEDENGVIEWRDKHTTDYIVEDCTDLQPGDIITFDVTSAVEHDLFNSDQTSFSGFVIDRSTDWEGYIEFYDHTDPENGPRLSVVSLCEVDEDCDDGITCTDDACVNNLCQSTPNDANCNDSVDCTIDTCDPTLDCQFAPNDASCDDGIYCNGEERCDPLNDCQARPPCELPYLCDENNDQCVLAEAIITPGDIFCTPGQTNACKKPICLDNLEDLVGGIQFDMCEYDMADDPVDCMACIDCELTERTTMFDCAVLELPNGCCRVRLFAKHPGGLINPGECDIVTIVYSPPC